MEYRIIKTTEDLQALQSDWQRLELLSPQITYFSTYDYCHTWWEVYKDCKEYSLFIVVVSHNNSSVGIAPMVLHQKGRRFLKYTSLEFLARGDYHDFLIDSTAEVSPMKIIKRIFSAIEENKGVWDEVNLTHISQHTLFARYLLKSELNKYFKYLDEIPYIDFSKLESYQQFKSLFLPDKTIQYHNRLKRKTDFSLVVTHENIVDKIADIHIAQKIAMQALGQEHRHSLYENSRRKKVKELLSNNASTTLTYLLIDKNKKDQIIAFNSGHLYNNVFYSLNIAFNPEYIKYGVGKVFYHNIFINNCQNPKWRVFDFGAGRYPWKFEWTSDFNLLYKLHYFKPGNKRMKASYMIKNLKNVFLK